MKTVRNLIYLIVLSVSLYVLPLNTDIFDFSASNIFDENEEKQVKNLQYECIFPEDNSKSFLLPLDIYEVKLASNEDFPENVGEKFNYYFEFYDSNNKKTLLEKSDIDADITVDGDEVNISIDLSKIAPKINYSAYTVKFILSCCENKFEDSFEFFNKKDGIALQNNNSEEDIDLKPFYYSDEEYRYSIPVYRKYINKYNAFASVMYSLSNESEKIESAKLIPFQIDVVTTRRPFMWYQNGKLSCSLTKQNLAILEEQKSKKAAEKTVENLLNSYEGNTNPYIVNEVELYLEDGSKKDIAGYSIAKPFLIERSAKVYLPMLYQKNKYYWVPVEFEQSDNIAEDVDFIFTLLKNCAIDYNDDRLISLLPKIKTHNSISFVDGKLIIDITGEMYAFLNNNQDYASMIKETLAISLSTLDGFDSYELWYDNNLVDEVNDVEFGANITAPSFFNRIE